MNKFIDDKHAICLVTKGIEENTGKFISQIAEEELSTKNICMLSGPSIAKELANGSKIGMVVASNSNYAKLTVKVCMENEDIIINSIDDIMGVQVASAAKNVFAIFCGILDGKKETDSLRAAVLSKLIVDLKDIIITFGGKEETLFSYAGLGDMLLTCMSDKSRNYTFGKLIGENMTPNKALKEMNAKTVEGLSTLEILYLMLKDKNIKIKSISTLYEIIYKGKNIENILKSI